MLGNRSQLSPERHLQVQLASFRTIPNLSRYLFSQFLGCFCSPAEADPHESFPWATGPVPVPEPIGAEMGMFGSCLDHVWILWTSPKNLGKAGKAGLYKVMVFHRMYLVGATNLGAKFCCLQKSGSKARLISKLFVFSSIAVALHL